MRGAGAVTALTVVAALAAGCGSVVDGTAKPAPNIKPQPITGATVKQVLLDGVALSRMLNQQFVLRNPPDFGGPEKLYHRDDVVSPADCQGVTAMLQRSIYSSADVRDVASESWWNNGEPAQVITVMEGVVSLPSAAAAQARFLQFADQWRKCNGTTTTEQTGPISTTNVISDVRVTDSFIAATNTATSTLPNMPPLRPTPQARAIGVRSNCIVEVEVVFFGDRRPSDPGSGTLDNSGMDVARAMMDRVSALG
ncbi:sensor domain-containing protein [Mycobacterium sp. 050134]|uniref:sensor domain-containing protein n=1 Tax=Mycobacterium sp. 050134 TaxID=3096111 RepID=UPI002ED8F5DD